MKNLKQLAQDALDVQNACSLLAVVNSFSKAVSDLREAVSGSTDVINNHPITIVWVDKLASLTGTQDLGNDRVMKAYSEVSMMAE